MSAKKSTEHCDVPEGAELSLQVIYDLRNVLKFHRALGIREYPATEALRGFLTRTLLKADKKPTAKIRSGNASPVRPPSESGAPAGPLLHDIRQELPSCTRCRLSSGRLGIVPGSGSERSGLMVIGDWSFQEKESFDPAKTFGPNEDAMLGKMMAAIGFQSSENYVTNCIKCCPIPGPNPDHVCLQSCWSFLEREIAAIRPRLILAMGDVAAKMLLDTNTPLVRLRGRFYKFRHQDAVPVAVMPTFHPRFLLHNKEMKKATWFDLQVIERYLAA